MKPLIAFFIVTIFTPSLILGKDNVALTFNNKLENIQKSQQKKQAQVRFKLEHSSLYYKELANKLKTQGKLREAVKNYEYAILLDQECSECYTSLGFVYYYLGQYTEAISYLNRALQYSFEFEWDKKKAQYLLITTYFLNNNSEKALLLLNKLASDYQSDLDRQVINGLNIKYEYYAPAFFLLTLYYRNDNMLQENINILQKALQLGFKKEYINYFFYEYYQSKGQESIAWEYLKQAKEIEPKIEKYIISMPFLKNYDIYQYITKE